MGWQNHKGQGYFSQSRRVNGKRVTEYIGGGEVGSRAAADTARRRAGRRAARETMLAEEAAALMPVKMVIPMALFMLPALFVMIFGGVVARFMTTGG